MNSLLQTFHSSFLLWKAIFLYSNFRKQQTKTEPEDVQRDKVNNFECFPYLEKLLTLGKQVYFLVKASFGDDASSDFIEVNMEKGEGLGRKAALGTRMEERNRRKTSFT